MLACSLATTRFEFGPLYLFAAVHKDWKERMFVTFILTAGVVALSCTFQQQQKSIEFYKIFLDFSIFWKKI
jgi:hypothetical protein